MAGLLVAFVAANHPAATRESSQHAVEQLMQVGQRSSAWEGCAVQGCAVQGCALQASWSGEEHGNEAAGIG